MRWKRSGKAEESRLPCTTGIYGLIEQQLAARGKRVDGGRRREKEKERVRRRCPSLVSSLVCSAILVFTFERTEETVATKEGPREGFVRSTSKYTHLVQRGRPVRPVSRRIGIGVETLFPLALSVLFLFRSHDMCFHPCAQFRSKHDARR